ncbi:1-deoxy-D-xylulose-5-phosphate synthase, partial [Methylobacterium sp. 174MFSha1.1]
MSECHDLSDLVLPLLDRVREPADLRQLPESDLTQLAAELRAET